MSEDLATNYPDRPESYYKKPYNNEPIVVAPGEGLFGSNILLPDISVGPDPDEVRAWKRKNNASVTDICKYFGLSRVQVVKVVGE